MAFIPIFSYLYDDNGNMTANDMMSNITYNHLDQPTDMAFRGTGASVGQSWDGAGRRTAKTYDNGAGNTQTTVYDGLFEMQTDASGQLALKYVYTPHGRLAFDAAGHCRAQYFMADHLGNIRLVYDDRGHVVQESHYYPYGMRIEGLCHGLDENALLYQGKALDAAAQWYYFGSRWYDARLGLWNATDPAGQMASPYTAMGGNPVVYVDPDGEFVIEFMEAIFAVTTAISWISSAVEAIQNKDWKYMDPTLDGTNINNNFDLWLGLFNTDPDDNFGDQALELASRFTWELPQTLVGVTGNSLNNAFGGVKDVGYFDGATVVNTYWGSGGMTLGPYIAGKGLEGSWQDHLFVHEYGHYIQSKVFGMLYLPLIAAPSGLTAMAGDRHDERWYEAWASRNAAVYFDDRYGAGKVGYTRNSPDYFDRESFVTSSQSFYQNPRNKGYNSTAHRTKPGTTFFSDFLYTLPSIITLSTSPYYLPLLY